VYTSLHSISLHPVRLSCFLFLLPTVLRSDEGWFKLPQGTRKQVAVLRVRVCLGTSPVYTLLTKHLLLYRCSLLEGQLPLARSTVAVDRQLGQGCPVAYCSVQIPASFLCPETVCHDVFLIFLSPLYTNIWVVTQRHATATSFPHIS
jgi:hypothetical protein